MAVNVDRVHLFIKYPPKYQVSGISKRIKGRRSKLLRDRFPQLKDWCPGQFYADFPKGNRILQSKIGLYGTPSCYHGTVGHGWEVVEMYMSRIGKKRVYIEKLLYGYDIHN